MAIILTLKDLIEIPEAFVIYDSRKRDSFLLIFNNGRIMEFKRAAYGLYYYDLHNFVRDEHKATDKDFHFLNLHSVFTQTVAERESFHTKIDLEKAKLAREYQEILMYLSSSDMKKILSRNLV